MTESCTTCADTGHWQGEPEPCPECGAFIVKSKRDPKSLRYIEKHVGPNRHDRRAQARLARSRR
jgi:hypothetical protein